MPITPEAHINLQYGIDMKSPKGTYKLTSGPNIVNFVGNKAPKLSTNLGTSLTISSDNIEYSSWL
jgi:hypothetical protein